jgi:hypothetical protein
MYFLELGSPRVRRSRRKGACASDCTLKRGGQYTFVSFDAESFENRYLMEPADKLALTGEQIFDARCALALLSEATENVRAHYVRRDKARTFELLKAS